VSIGKNATVLFYAAGWVVIPGALAGLWIACSRPRSRAESAFGLLTGTTMLALLLEAAVWGDTYLAQERYVFYVLPLILVTFCLQAERGWPLRRVQVLAALALLVISVRVPLVGWAEPGISDHSPFLLAFARLEMAAGVTGGAWIVAIASAVLCLVAALAPWRPRAAAPILLSLALAGSFAALLGATAFDHLNSLLKRDIYLAADRSWVDHAGVGPATLVHSPGQRRADSEEQLFWNTAVQRVVLLPGATPPDALGSEQLRISADGTLRTDAGPLRGPLVVGKDGATIVFRGARRVASAPADTLWLPVGNARLRLFVAGRAPNGLIWSGGRIDFWSDGPGRLLVSVRGRDVKVGGHAVHGSKTIAFPVCSAGRTSVRFSAALTSFEHGRPVGGHMRLPRFVPDPNACKDTRS
jgi:hypothetical protein